MTITPKILSEILLDKAIPKTLRTRTSNILVAHGYIRDVDEDRMSTPYYWMQRPQFFRVDSARLISDLQSGEFRKLMGAGRACESLLISRLSICKTCPRCGHELKDNTDNTKNKTDGKYHKH